MKLFFNHLHEQHHGRAELIDGALKPCFEKPERVAFILEEINRREWGELLNPAAFSLDPILAIHDPKMIEFYQTIWASWVKKHGDIDVLPLNYPCRGMRQVLPKEVDGQVSYFAFDAGSPLHDTSWTAIKASADTCLAAAQAVLQGSHSAFALTRPPGHHAHADQYGGYCFLNNAAIVSQWLRDQGKQRISILDVDYHHGNGTQDIFYARSDVQFLSLHADPDYEYPFFLGRVDEVGTGAGEGFNHNYPLLWGTQWPQWEAALLDALKKIEDFNPDVLVISLGVDTYEEDPISQFKLKSAHFKQMGQHLAQLNRPTVFLMEGGYATQAIGVNVVNVLEGFREVKD